jgi:hypothetical protein
MVFQPNAVGGAAQNFTVPAGVTRVLVKAWGGWRRLWAWQWWRRRPCPSGVDGDGRPDAGGECGWWWPSGDCHGRRCGRLQRRRHGRYWHRRNGIWRWRHVIGLSDGHCHGDRGRWRRCGLLGLHRYCPNRRPGWWFGGWRRQCGAGGQRRHPNCGWCWWNRGQQQWCAWHGTGGRRRR